MPGFQQLAHDSIENGMPAERADALHQLNEVFRSGRAGVVTDDVENLTGTIRAWCERDVDALRQAALEHTAA